MPKRIKTPPLAEDSKYLVVVHPFPLGGHWELVGDRQELARWLGCIVPKEYFISFYYKPKARNMVIVQIQNAFNHWESLLGEHTWSDFLQNPTAEQATGKTKVFYCKHSTGREAQKNGWLEVAVKDEWYAQWSHKNSIIRFPYPPTKWCDLPIEDKTNEPLCRPLPKTQKPPATVPPPKPVVGSSHWASAKEAPPPARGVWGKTPPKSLSVPSARPVVAPAPVRGSGSSRAAASVATAPAAPPGLVRATKSNQTHHVTVSESIQDALYNLSLAYDEANRDPDVDPNLCYGAAWEAETPAANNEWTSYKQPEGPTEVLESLWGDETVVEAEVELCRDHGTLCKRGICKERDRMYKEAEKIKNFGSNGKLNSSGSKKPSASTRGWKNSSTNSSSPRNAGYNNNNGPSTRRASSHTSSSFDDNESTTSGRTSDDGLSTVSGKSKASNKRAPSVAGSSGGWSTVSSTPWGR